MLQDLAFGRLENEYKPVPPRENDAVLCFREGKLLVKTLSNGALVLPTASQIPGKLQYAFRLHDVNYYLAAEPGEEGEFRYTPVRQLRESPSRSLCTPS